MSRMRTSFIFVVAILVLGGWASVFQVDEREQAILLRLGEIVRTDYKPGLHFKVPVYNNVIKFDRRILTLDGKPEQILTGEKKNVLVDYFVKWVIADTGEFYRAFSGSEKDASFRMAQTIKNELQAQLGDRTIKDVVSGDRKEIMQNVTQNADTKLMAFGIKIFDVRIKQIELPPKVAESVYRRMRVERERIANEHRAKGEKESKIIRSKADRMRVELLAAARREAEENRGAGDARATKIYALAYGKDKEFYNFYRSMEAYRNSFADKRDVLVLEPDSEFFTYFGGTGKPR
ncbi:MAG TPA: protease modulator HflC [Acidiferrobacteraceae bacterium]|nr:protease modulator HflC [Acidiferrobacteraceae bacterium]